MLSTLVPVSNLYRIACATYIGHTQVSAVGLFRPARALLYGADIGKGIAPVDCISVAVSFWVVVVLCSCFSADFSGVTGCCLKDS